MARKGAPPQRGKSRNKKSVPVPSSTLDERSDEDVLSDEDLDFVASEAQRLDFLKDMKTKQLDKSVTESRKKKTPKGPQVPRTFEEAGIRRYGEEIASEESEEDDEGAEDYERRRRQSTEQEQKAQEQEQRRRVEVVLPTKSLEGELVHQRRAVGKGTSIFVPGVSIEDDTVLPDNDEGEEKVQEDVEREALEPEKIDERVADKTRRTREPSSILATLSNQSLSQAQRLQLAKEHMALAAQAVLGDPERRLAQLAEIVDLAQLEDSTVSRLAQITCASVFADIVPGYRIRSLSEQESGQLLSKEVRALRDFEQALLRQYQRYLRATLRALTNGPQDPAGARVAARCLCRSLLAAPHFNYSTDILQAVVPVTTAKDPALRSSVLDALGQLFASRSADGSVVTEAVQLLADVVKKRDCVCPREIVETLAKLHTAQIASAKDFQEARNIKKKKKNKKKRGDEVDAAFAESQAVQDAKTRQYQQAMSLEALFEVYFRVLKHATASALFAEMESSPLSAERFAKKFPLLFPVLEQIASHAYLIGVEYFGDLMAVFDKLLASSALPPAERVRTLLTVATILSGQGDALNVDRGAFYVHLYRAVDLCCLEEPHEEEEEENGKKTTSEQRRHGSVNNSIPSPTSTYPLLVELCEKMLTDRRALDSARQAAFAKRLAAAAAASRDPGLALGILAVLGRLLRQSGRLAAMLHNESGGPSGFMALRLDAPDPAEAGALATPMWELALLSRHWHPHVSQMAIELAQSVAQPGSSILPSGATPHEVAHRCSTRQGRFRPAPLAPRTGGKRGRGIIGSTIEEESQVEARLKNLICNHTWTDAAMASGCGDTSRPLGQSKRARKKQRREAAAATGEAHLNGGLTQEKPTDEGQTWSAFSSFFKTIRRFEEYRRVVQEKQRLVAQIHAFQHHLEERE